MLRNILFLDIDGVLNHDKEDHPHVFAPDCVHELRRILEASPHTQIVLSTSWRTGFSLFALGWLWRQHGLPDERVMGRTSESRTGSRGAEIKQWLDNPPLLAEEYHVGRFAVLDDEVEDILQHIPEQSVFACDPWHGLTEAVANQVIRHLAAPSSVA